MCEPSPLQRAVFRRLEEKTMRARPYKQSTATAFPEPVTNEFVTEALARQAALRPAKTPPNEMPVTPTLPRVPKPRGRRRRGAK